MKYQLGDTVLLLHSDEEGQIIDIINEKMVMVNVKGTLSISTACIEGIRERIFTISVNF